MSGPKPTARGAEAAAGDGLLSLLQLPAVRRDSSLVVLEGFHAVKHALRFGAQLLGLWTADAGEIEDLRRRLAPDVAMRPQVVDGETLRAAVGRGQLLGVARRPRQPDPDSVLAEPRGRPVVLLEQPRHLGNLGAAVRVSAAAGAAGVLSIGEADPWHPDAVRGAAGLQFALPVHRLRAPRRGDRPLVALDPGGEALDVRRLDPRAVLAFGTERDGLSDELLAQADACVALPMATGVSSLNLATAVSATLYALAVTRS